MGDNIPVPARTIGDVTDAERIRRHQEVMKSLNVPCSAVSHELGMCVLNVGHYRWTNHQNIEGKRWAEIKS